jgi:hypothetical protein
MKARRLDRLSDLAIDVFLWAFRVVVILVVVWLLKSFGVLGHVT